LNGPERVGQRLQTDSGFTTCLKNVHEWCATGYDERYYLGSPAKILRVRTWLRRPRVAFVRHQIKITRVAPAAASARIQVQRLRFPRGASLAARSLRHHQESIADRKSMEVQALAGCARETNKDELQDQGHSLNSDALTWDGE